MSIPHVHLALTHAPIFAVLIGVAVLFAALVRRSAEVRWTSYALFFLGALVAVPVFLSGEGSEEALENVAGVSEAAIHAHAAAAAVSLTAIEILGILSLGAFVFERMRGRITVPVTALLVVFASLTTASLAYTANLGGQIHHSELRAGAATSETMGAGAAPDGKAGPERAGATDKD